MSLSDVEFVVAQFELAEVLSIEFLGGAGGFSGAQIWKLKTRDRIYCLRRWPQTHPNRQRLEWINLVLIHAFSNGCPFVPVPLESLHGLRFVEHRAYFWELAPWMPGAADFETDPSPVRLENVIASLAKFHQASAQVNLDFRKSDNVMARFTALQQAGSLIDQIGQSEAGSQHASIHDLRQVILRDGERRARELATEIEPFTNEVFPVQPVIRDVWHDHVLFSGEDVTGIVDYGAMQIDHIALDLSRIMGSLIGGQSGHAPIVGNHDERWQSALATYSGFRPLQPAEIELVSILDRCATLLGSLNWLKWILIERRSFESTEQVEKRIRHLIHRQV